LNHKELIILSIAGLTHKANEITIYFSNT